MSIKNTKDRTADVDNNKTQGSVKVRKIIGLILIIAVVVLTINLSIVMIHKINSVVLKDSYVKGFSRELILMGVLLVGALDVYFGFFAIFKNKILKIVGWVLRIIVLAACIFILFLCGKVIVGGLTHSTEKAGYVIVLGLALENGKAPKDLEYRVDTAYKYKKENPEALLILTGGNPGEDGRTEAEVMQEMLLAKGVAEEDLILEDKASNTRENFKNSIKKMPDNVKIALITNNYHMNRAKRIAKEAGFNEVIPVPAPATWYSYFSSVLWEVIMELNTMINGG